MCGVIGLIGVGSVFDHLKDGLKALEYRGYDSCGLLLCAFNEQIVMRTIGSSSNFETDPFIDRFNHVTHKEDEVLGLGHNRWATHGAVCIENTHPVENDDAYVVHNGVVENVQDFVIDADYKGNTDTERVLVFFTSLLKQYTPEHALKIVMDKLVGMSVFVFVLKQHPERFYFFRKGLNPLYISAVKKESIVENNIKIGVCSDANVLEKWFDSVYIVQDEQCGYVDVNGVKLFSENQELVKQELDSTEDDSEKTHKTWLRTEMDQQSIMLGRAMRSVLSMDWLLKEKAKQYSQICFIGCGSAYYAGCIARQWCHEYGISAQAILASEFIDYAKILNTPYYQKALYVFISQSGQTLETIEAASMVQEMRNNHKKNENKHSDDINALSICELDVCYDSVGIINSPNSTLAQYLDHIIYTNAGVENSVASTKGFTSQLMALGCVLAQMLDQEESEYVLESLKSVSSRIDEVKRNDQLRDVCDQYEVLYVLSKGIGVDIAHEMALKIKELTYIHTDSFSSSEFKHGPLSLVDEDFLALVINPMFGSYDRIKANVMEIVSRGGSVVVLTDQIWEDAGENVTFYQMPMTNIITAPFLYVKAGQELAYSIAVKNKYNIDQPRNLVKSVTVI